MATYDNLPVFKACYDLMLYVMEWSVKVQRDLRYTIAEDMKKSMVETLRCIYRANKSHGSEKEAHIRHGQEAMMEAKLYLRILSDCHQITLQQYAQTAEKAVEVEKQLSNWQRSLVATSSRAQ